MIFGNGVDNDAGTYTVFEEVRLSAEGKCGRTLSVVVAKQQQQNGAAALSALVTAHREACEPCREAPAIATRAKAISAERKVKYETPRAETRPLPSIEQFNEAQTAAAPEVPLAFEAPKP